MLLNILEGCKNDIKQEEVFVKNDDDSFFSSRMDLLDERVLELMWLQNHSLPISLEFKNKYDALNEMKSSLRSAINKNQNLDLSQWETTFLNDSKLKTKSWSKGEVSINKAILFIDQLIFDVRMSDYCNNLYVCEDVGMDLVKTSGKISFILTPQMKFQGYYIGSKDSVNNVKYLNKQKIIKADFIDLNKYSKMNKIEGGVMVQRLNNPICIPFEIKM